MKYIIVIVACISQAMYQKFFFSRINIFIKFMIHQMLFVFNSAVHTFIKALVS